MATVAETPIWAVIRPAMEAKPISYRGIEAKTSGIVTKGDLGHWKNGTFKQLSPGKLVALATVLDVPAISLVSAALRTLGYPIGGSTIEDSINDDRILSPLAKRRILDLVERERRLEAGARAAKKAARPHRRGDPTKPMG